MSGVSGVTVVTALVCFLHFAREAAGALAARHSLRPLISEGGTLRTKLARNARRDREAVSAMMAVVWKVKSMDGRSARCPLARCRGKIPRRPCESRDPYAAPSLSAPRADAF